MRGLVTILFVILAWALPLHAVSRGDSLSVMFWNVENFFDYFNDDGGDSDAEFSPHGVRRWTKRRFYAKCNAIAKTILWTGEKYGRLPDLVGLAEIENGFVLRKLLSETALRKLDYGIIHYESPDHRGIDVALLYRRSEFESLSSRPVHVSGSMGGDSLKTRDILVAVLRRGGKEFGILVNHHPSKYGGGDSDWRRDAAIRQMQAVGDSLRGAGVSYVISMGDFNDTPENVRCGDLLNLALPLAAKGRGSIRYNGKWELIDMFMVNPEIGNRCRMDILEPPFLMVWDNTHPGFKPLRTYTGPRYNGGVSDHSPILLRFAECSQDSSLLYTKEGGSKGSRLQRKFYSRNY